MLEKNARIKIDKLLRESDWILSGDDGIVNVGQEVECQAGIADYVLKDGSGSPLCVIEAKKELANPLDGKEQARGYVGAFNCRFAILSNGISHYLWDVKRGNSPESISIFPSPKQLELTKTNFNPPRQANERIDVDYIAQTQLPGFEQNPDYLDEREREDFIRNNKIRMLRDYQLQAVRAVQNGVAEGKDRFLLEMATGTGKTLTSCAIMKMFLRLYNVKRVLFLVDRLELEKQAQKEFDEVLKNDFRTIVWKEKQSDWEEADIVVSTVQSFYSCSKYRKLFNPDSFDLVISDEAHRSLGEKSRIVFEYFIGFKLGLTATPKDYLKSVNISETDSNQVEQRMLLDTYATFWCESGEPTFRYSLENGVKDGYLINPKVIAATTKITAKLMSEKGYVFKGVDENGNDLEEIFKKKDFEKKFFSESTNTIFCETFLKYAMRDPYTGEIGKTLVFCVSQNHAANITQILNVLADRVLQEKYDSDFAMQVTSNVRDSQKMTIDFRNNSLRGAFNKEPCYRTSKARVCVTVNMMATGYDCPDILNICMMRPIHSPSDFIQIKGRGTRRFDFSQSWITKSNIPDDIDSQKKQFMLFDFFGNYDYFEKGFDYDKVIQLPSKPIVSITTQLNNEGIAISSVPDLLAEFREIQIHKKCMKIDRNLYRSFKKKVAKDETLKKMVKQFNFVAAGDYLRDKYFNKPQEFFTMDKLGKSLGLDRLPTNEDLLLHVFDYIKYIPSQGECLEEDFDKMDKALKIPEENYQDAKDFFEAYTTDDNYREMIDGKRYAELSVHPYVDSFKKLPIELQQRILVYIKQNVNLERLKNVR